MTAATNTRRRRYGDEVRQVLVDDWGWDTDRAGTVTRRHSDRVDMGYRNGEDPTSTADSIGMREEGRSIERDASVDTRNAITRRAAEVAGSVVQLSVGPRQQDNVVGWLTSKPLPEDADVPPGATVCGHLFHMDGSTLTVDRRYAELLVEEVRDAASIAATEQVHPDHGNPQADAVALERLADRIEAAL